MLPPIQSRHVASNLWCTIFCFLKPVRRHDISSLSRPLRCCFPFSAPPFRTDILALRRILLAGHVYHSLTAAAYFSRKLSTVRLLVSHITPSVLYANPKSVLHRTSLPLCDHCNAPTPVQKDRYPARRRLRYHRSKSSVASRLSSHLPFVRSSRARPGACPYAKLRTLSTSFVAPVILESRVAASALLSRVRAICKEGA